MTKRTAEQVYRELGEVMTKTFPDRDISALVGPETKVFGDLGLASIDLVVLGERLELFYGRRLPYGQFLAELRNRNAEDLELGELVAFLVRHVG